MSPHDAYEEGSSLDLDREEPYAVTDPKLVDVLMILVLDADDDDLRAVASVFHVPVIA